MNDAFKLIVTEFLKLVTGELDQYTTEKGSVEFQGDFKAVLLTPAHIQWAKYGRGPGKQPPYNNILDFVKKKGIIFNGSDQEGTAWAIAKSIAKNGTKNYVPNAPNALNEAIQNNLEKYNKDLAKFITIKTNDELTKTYEKVFPPKVEIKL